MNKLEGFFELKRLGIPTIPWKQFVASTHLEPSILWTIRTAVFKGDDLNLPRKIGATADEATCFAINLLNNYDWVIYYPYFIAEKSGVLEVAIDKIVIEAVQDDLWNLVTYNKIDVSIIITDNVKFVGNEIFLTHEEIDELVKYAQIIKKQYRDEIYSGKSIFLEWSYMYKSNIEKEAFGERSLVFYELRSVD